MQSFLRQRPWAHLLVGHKHLFVLRNHLRRSGIAMPALRLRNDPQHLMIAPHCPIRLRLIRQERL